MAITKHGDSRENILILEANFDAGIACSVVTDDKEKYMKRFKEVTGRELEMIGDNNHYLVRIK